MTQRLGDPVLVTAHEHLLELSGELRASSQLGVDIESNSFYAYWEKVCLIQISTPNLDVIIDPIAIKDISPLGPLFADPSIQKIFHAGDYDILCLKRDYGFSFTNVFDTMIAARLLGVKKLGLAAAIEQHFGIKISKKLQRADWGRRPLSAAHLQYARLDTHYLIELADIQKKLLEQKGRWEDAGEAFQALALVVPSEKVLAPDGFRRWASGHKLAGQQLACLKELYLLREHHAQSRNLAPFRVMPEDLLVRLAATMPEDLELLRTTKGMTPYLLQKFGTEMLEAIKRGRQAPPPETPPPSHHRKNPKEWKLFQNLKFWRKLKAEAEGVDPVVIVSSATLREIARLSLAANSDPLKKLSPLKRLRYGAEILNILKANP